MLVRPVRTLVLALALTGAPTASALALAGPVGADEIPSDLPAGVPRAARIAEPRLPVPDGWPFAQRLSRTSGTGRLHDGASYWTDFVYDDHGAAVPGGMTLDNTATLAPEQGVYEYADSRARGNGADILIAAVGATRRATYWRIDWSTLADPRVPIAVWTFDTDADERTGGRDWPAAAGITSRGIEKALVVSNRGAWLHDLVRGDSARVGRLTVDRSARSFVVRVPRRALPATGSWRVRLAAGVATADGLSLAAPKGPDDLPISGLPHVYNVAFRRVRQERPVHTDSMTATLAAELQRLAAGTPPFDQFGADGLARFVTGNFWMEDNQADTLYGGDVSRFSRVIDWSRLSARARTREPLVRGYSNRWYASALRLGQGMVPNSGGSGDGRPNYLGRVQPYAVYVPESYRRSRPAPLTWVLHSLDVNHNQYGAFAPRLLARLCERRGSICASTLGYGPDGWYLDEAEVDFWSVWRSVAHGFRLSPRRTVISGYSMGGYGTYKLGLAHPDLFAAAISLAGPPVCGVSLDGGGLTGPAFGGRCESDGGTAALVGNARWLPFRIAHGVLDELVPFTSVEQQVTRFDGLGLRHRFVRYPLEDHMVFAVQDRFDTVLQGLGTPAAPRRPWRIDHTWRPHLTRPGLGIGATTAYWTSGLAARDSGPGELARVEAWSHALPGSEPRILRSGPTPVSDPLPASVEELRWRAGPANHQVRYLQLTLTNVARVRVDMRRAALPCGDFSITTDGPARVRLVGLRGDDRLLSWSTSGTRVVHRPC